MARQLDTITMSAKFKDRNGDVSTMSIPWAAYRSDASGNPTTDRITFEELLGAWDAIQPLVESLSGLVYTGVSFTLNYFEDDANPVNATEPGEVDGVFTFHTLNQRKVQVSVPGFLQGKLVNVPVAYESKHQIIDISDPDVIAFVNQLITGVTVPTGVVRPGLDDNYYTISLADANYVHRPSRTKRRTRG